MEQVSVKEQQQNVKRLTNEELLWLGQSQHGTVDWKAVIPDEWERRANTQGWDKEKGLGHRDWVLWTAALNKAPLKLKQWLEGVYDHKSDGGISFEENGKPACRLWANATPSALHLTIEKDGLFESYLVSLSGGCQINLSTFTYDWNYWDEGEVLGNTSFVIWADMAMDSSTLGKLMTQNPSGRPYIPVRSSRVHNELKNQFRQATSQSFPPGKVSVWNLDLWHKGLLVCGILACGYLFFRSGKWGLAHLKRVTN